MTSHVKILSNKSQKNPYTEKQNDKSPIYRRKERFFRSLGFSSYRANTTDGHLRFWITIPDDYFGRVRRRERIREEIQWMRARAQHQQSLLTLLGCAGCWVCSSTVYAEPRTRDTVNQIALECCYTNFWWFNNAFGYISLLLRPWTYVDHWKLPDLHFILT